MMVIESMVLWRFGSETKIIGAIWSGSTDFWGVVMSNWRWVVMGVGLSLMGGVASFMRWTKLGRAMRASASDPEAAALQGISLNRMSAMVMVIAGGLAGLAGGIMSLTVAVGPYFGAVIIIKAFIVVIIGGMGSVGGTLIAALIFGFLDSTVSTLINPRITVLLDVVVLLFILTFRPRGLFGRD